MIKVNIDVSEGFEYPVAIWDSMECSSLEKLTYVALWGLKAQGKTSPTTPEIAKFLNVSQATAVQAVKGLEEKCWIKRTPFKKARGFGYEYTLYESPEYPEIEVSHATLANRKNNDLTAPRRKQFGREVR